MLAFRFPVALITSAILTGCVGAASVGKREVAVYKDSITSINTISGNTAYAQKLADEYLRQATTASETQDAIAFGTIGAAATGAGGLLYNSGFDLIKGAGLAAGTTAAVGNYLKPDETILALLDAAEQLVCIAKSGEMADSQLGPSIQEAAEAANSLATAQMDLETARREAQRKAKEKTAAKARFDAKPNDRTLKEAFELARAASADADRVKDGAEKLVEDLRAASRAASDTHVVEAVDILGIGIRQARINLRKKLVRQRPDYSSLINQLSNTASAAIEIEKRARGTVSLTAPETVEKLRADVAKCLLIAI